MESLFSIFAALALAQAQGNDERLGYSVLYAGNEGTPYTESWRRMLEPRVKSLRVMSLADVEAEDLAGIDVLVIGGEVETRDASGNVRLKSEHYTLSLELMQGFPVVLMGGQGGLVSDAWMLKTSWQHG